ncbi:MAG: helix-hairpin-helix domain-containing protein [Bacteroidota bacterium]|nr:helix-hairpin-helix domain-containing protein [Bacteroidota bacterium]
MKRGSDIFKQFQAALHDTVQKALDYAAFTKNEQKVFLMLAVVFLAGAGIKLYKAYVIPPSVKEFDYAASDSAFSQHSAKLSSLAHVVNLNTASKEELDRLPGVGKEIAEEIIAYRTTHGKFTRLEELKKIKGIGERKFKALQQRVSIE